MIANYTSYCFDPKTGAHYALPQGLPKPVCFQLPTDKLAAICKGVKRYRNLLYERLKAIDQDFYVMVEQKPGQGFERVIPANPVYNPANVWELRDITLQEIEQSANTSVHLHYYIDSKTLEITGVLEYPNLAGGKEYTRLVMMPESFSTREFEHFNHGNFFIALPELIIPS